MDKTTQIVFIVFTAVVSVGVIIQAGAIIATFMAARKTQKKLHALIEDFRIHVLPAVSSSRAMIEDLSPKLKMISSNLVESSNELRTMADQVGGVVADAVGRTRVQVAHVDGMVEGALDQIARAANTIQSGIAIPVRQLTGIVNGLRAALNVIWSRPPQRQAEAEDDLFV